jgi:arylsulfatase
VGFGGNFVGMLKRHMGMKQKYPDREPGRGLPYGGIENLRPETKALVQSMAAWMKQPKGK